MEEKDSFKEGDVVYRIADATPTHRHVVMRLTSRYAILDSGAKLPRYKPDFAKVIGSNKWSMVHYARATEELDKKFTRHILQSYVSSWFLRGGSHIDKIPDSDLIKLYNILSKYK